MVNSQLRFFIVFLLVVPTSYAQTPDGEATSQGFDLTFLTTIRPLTAGQLRKATGDPNLDPTTRYSIRRIRKLGVDARIDQVFRSNGAFGTGLTIDAVTSNDPRATNADNTAHVVTSESGAIYWLTGLNVSGDISLSVIDDTYYAEGLEDASYHCVGGDSAVAYGAIPSINLSVAQFVKQTGLERKRSTMSGSDDISTISGVTKYGLVELVVDENRGGLIQSLDISRTGKDLSDLQPLANMFQYIPGESGIGPENDQSRQRYKYRLQSARNVDGLWVAETGIITDSLIYPSGKRSNMQMSFELIAAKRMSSFPEGTFQAQVTEGHPATLRSAQAQSGIRFEFRDGRIRPWINTGDVDSLRNIAKSAANLPRATVSSPPSTTKVKLLIVLAAAACIVSSLWIARTKSLAGGRS